MVKKMKFPFPFKFTEIYPSSTTTTTPPTITSSWPWPTCANTPKTASFRVTNYEKSPPCYVENNDENVLGVLKSSDRLFFEPGRTSSIMETTKTVKPTTTSMYEFPYKESAKIMGMDSTDPFVDFRASMEEMVEANGLKDWAGLEDLLTCYLKLNDKSNHGYIVSAYVDLVLHLALANSCEDSLSSLVNEVEYSSNSFTSPLSFSSSTESSTVPSLENSSMVVVESHGESSCSSS